MIEWRIYIASMEFLVWQFRRSRVVQNIKQAQGAVKY